MAQNSSDINFNAPQISIIVATYNAKNTLPSCLDSLINLDYPKDDLEIIVVDNNSTDTTKDIIKRYPVKYVFEHKRSRGGARNKGIRESQGEIIVFIDSDCVADKFWLGNLLKGFSDTNIGGCGGEILSYRPITMAEKYFNLNHPLPQKMSLFEKGILLPSIMTANAAYTRKALEETGLFDDRLVATEDVDLSWRVFLKGYQLVYVPDALVYHKNRSTWIASLEQHFETSYFMCLIRQKHINCIKQPLVSVTDLFNFFREELRSAGHLFISLFTSKNLLDRIFPLFEIMHNAVSFSGEVAALAKLRFGIEKISPLPCPEKLLWRIVDDEAVIFNPVQGFSYDLDVIGTKIWKLLTEGRDISEIANIIANDYGVNREDIESDIETFYDELKKEDLCRMLEKKKL